MAKEKVVKRNRLEEESKVFTYKVNYRDENIRAMDEQEEEFRDVPKLQIEDKTIHEKKPLKEVKSFLEKLNDITTNEDGTITHNLIKNE